MDRVELISKLPKDLIWAELGVFTGDFSKEIYFNCKPKKLYLVDIFPNNMISGDKDGENIRVLNLENIPNELNYFFKNETSSVEIVKSTTIEFLQNLINSEKKIDCVYIDADHSYESVKSDLELSYKVINDGGFICGHDYSEEYFYGVYKAVNEFCEEKNLKITHLSDDKLPTFIIKK